MDWSKFEPDRGDTEGVIKIDDWSAFVPDKPVEGGFVASVKSGMGSLIKGAGQAAGDFLPGVDQDNALKKYGQSVIEANPTAVHNLSDIADKPWTAVKEAAGNAGGSIGQMLGARAVGSGITMLSPWTGPAAPAVALLGQAVSWLGPAAIAALPSYGGIRDKQILNDPANNDAWKAKAVAALGAAAVGAIETKFGPQQWALGAMTKEGRAALAEKFAETTLAKGIGYGALKGAAIEGAEELVQNPIEQLAAGDDPTTKANLKDTAFSGVMGALGGGALGGGFGMAFREGKREQPKVTPADIVSPEVKSVDEAIAVTQAAIEAAKPAESTNPADLLGTQTQTPNQSFLGAARATQEQQQADAADLADLVQSETRNLQVMRAHGALEREKAAELDQIHSQSVETLGRLPDQQVAAAMAATDETPTAMQLAMQRALAAKAQPDQVVANLPQNQADAAPALAETVVEQPRLVERTPDMVAMPQKLAQQRAAANTALEVVRIANVDKATGRPNGKFAYTVIPKAADVSATASILPEPTGNSGRGAPQQSPTMAPGLGRGSDTGTAVVAGRDGNSTSSGPVLSANQPAAVDPRLIPVSQREASRENAAQAPQEARAAAEPAAVPAAGDATLQAVTKEKPSVPKADQAQQATPQRQETPAAGQRLIPVSKRTQQASPAQPLRRASYDKNPLLTFLATHGLYHETYKERGELKNKPGSHKAEFSPDKQLMVSGYGPVFRKTGQRVDALVPLAIQDGYLPKNGTDAQLSELIRRAVAGEKIQPMYAEGVAEAEAERQIEAQRALEEDWDSAQNEPTPEEAAQGVEAVSQLSDAELFALDEAIPINSSGNASTEDFLRAMGASEQEIQDAIAEQSRVAQARAQGRAGTQEAATSQAPRDSAQRDEEARPGTAELTSPTRADILAQQAQREAEAKRKEDGGDKPLPRRELTGDVPDMFNTQGSVFDVPQEPAAKATAILDAANVTGKERIDALKDVKKGDITPEELKAAYPAKIEDVGEKIGGARKDTSVSTGPKKERASTEEDTRPTWAKRFQISQVAKGFDTSVNGRDITGKWTISDLRTKDRLGQPQQLGRYFDTREDAEAALPLLAVAQKHRVLSGAKAEDGTYKQEIWRDINDRKRVKVVDREFATREDAMRYMAQHAKEILDTNTTFGEADIPKPDSTQRKGVERRTGDVKGEDFRDAFGMRAVEFGNWNNQDERQEVMNAAYDGLMDLAEVLGVPPKAIGLNGDLALAFGARGHGLSSARAHYERDRVVMNLTKMNGAGALAHEWFHALDHYLARQDGKTTAEWKVNKDGTRSLDVRGGESDMASGGFRTVNSGVREELRSAYTSLVQSLFTKAEQYVEDTARADKFVAVARGELEKELGTLRADLASQLDARYYKRNNKPASAEQLAEFDTLAAELVEGRGLSTEWKHFPGKTRLAIQSRHTNETLEKLNEIYKAVRGRSGFNAERRGVIDALTGYMKRYDQRMQMLREANALTTKTRRVPTSFAMDAKSLDQGRGGNYWTSPHEMVARAFQGYVEDAIAAKDGKSPFLNYAPEGAAILTPWGAKRPFPSGDERKAMNSEFDKFIGAIKTKETDKGVAMFSRSEQNESNEGESHGTNRSQLPANQDDHTTVGGGAPARGWREATRIRRKDGTPGSVTRGAKVELSADHFDPKALGQASQNPSSGLGVWFTTGGEASRFGPIVETFHLDIRNPKVFTEGPPGFGSVQEATAYREKLRSQGYDGIALDYRKLGGPLHLVAFDPHQVIYPEKSKFSRGAGSTRAFEPLANQTTARSLNDALVDYGLGQDWSNAYEAVKLPDALSGIRKAFQVAFGRDVRAVAPTAVKFNIFNGVYIPSQPNAVYVNVSSNPGFVNVAGHELWHAIKRQRPDLIDWYRTQSRQFYKDLPAYQNRLNQFLQPGEKPYALDKAEEELEADFLGDSLTDVGFLQSLADASPSKFKSLLAHVRLWLDGVIGKLKSLGSTKEVTDAKALQGYLKSVLVAFAEGKTLPEAPGNIAFNRGTTEAVTKSNDVVGNQGGRSADDNNMGTAHSSPIPPALESLARITKGKAFDAAKRAIVAKVGSVGPREKFADDVADAVFLRLQRVSQAGMYTDESDLAYRNAKRLDDDGEITIYRALPKGADIRPGDFAAGTKHEAGFYTHGENKIQAFTVPKRDVIAVDGSSGGGKEYVYLPKGHQQIEPIEHFSSFKEFYDAVNSSPNEPTAPDSGGAMFSRSQIVGQTNRQHTPEQLRAMANVGFQVEVPTLKERAQALWKDAGKKLAQGIVDQFAPVKALDKDAYGLLRLAKGASGAFEAFLRGGQLKLTDGVYDFDDANKGGVVEKLLIPLQGEHHDFMRWVAANRAERLASEGKENLFSAQDIADLKTLADGTTDFDYTIQTGPAKGRVTRDRTLIYADANRIFNAFNKNILDMAEQSGLIDGASRKLWENEFYVPFYRVADDADGGVRGMNIKGGVVRQEAFKALKGGKNALNADLLDNTLMNWAHLLDAAAKNRAAKATIEAAERMGVAAGGNQSTLAQMGASIHNKHGVVWFMDQGQKRFSLIDDPYLMTAITSLEYAGMRNPVMNAMGFMKHALTIGVTASPFFKVRNLIRDSVQAIGTGPLNYNPATNVKEGWKLTDPKSDAYFRLLAGGGTIHFGTMLEGSEAKRVQALVESGVDDATILNSEHKVKAFYRKFIEPGITAYNELGNRGEAINRAALYDQLRKQGLSHADASLQARDLMDFSMQGSFTTIRFLTQVVPFFNARVQGLYKLGRSAKENPARFAVVIGATSLAGLALLAAYSGDPDWEKRELWDRNNYFWFKFGGVAFRIPRPFEIGAVATLAERTAEFMFTDELNGKQFKKAMLNVLSDQLAMNPIPQLVKPILDVYSNKDSFTGRPIESMGMEHLKSDYRFTNNTSMVARAASTGLNALTQTVGAEGYSPVQIDHLVRGYFSWLGAFVVGASDMVARPLTNQPTHASSDLWKVATGGMVSDLRDAPSKFVTQMYEQAKVVEEAYGTYRALQKEGKAQEAQEFAAANRADLSKYRNIEHVKKMESRLSERRRVIERSNMDADTKRALIRDISVQQDRIAQMVQPG